MSELVVVLCCPWKYNNTGVYGDPMPHTCFSDVVSFEERGILTAVSTVIMITASSCQFVILKYRLDRVRDTADALVNQALF